RTVSRSDGYDRSVESDLVAPRVRVAWKDDLRSGAGIPAVARGHADVDVVRRRRKNEAAGYGDGQLRCDSQHASELHELVDRRVAADERLQTLPCRARAAQRTRGFPQSEIHGHGKRAADSHHSPTAAASNKGRERP